MNKRIFILILLSLLIHSFRAKAVEHENILKLKYGWNTTLDPYLSPLRYNGAQIGFGNEWWQPFATKNGDTHWAHVGMVDVAGQRAYSTARSNYFYALGAQAGWGAHYVFDIIGTRDNSHTFSGLQIILGPYLNIDFMAREHASQVNKPYSFDLGIDAMLMAGIASTWHVSKAAFRLRYLARTNLIGTHFAPDYWQSYFEIYENGIKQVVHASGPWNRNTIHHELTLDISAPHSTWRVGAEHDYLHYTNPARNMTWSRNQISIVIGCIWKYRVDGKAF